MPSQINVTANSYPDIRKEIVKFVEQNKSKYPILSQYPNTISNQLIDMLSAAVTFNNYKYEKNRQETYISTAKLASSIYERAKELSYNIHRKSCPIVRFTVTKDINLFMGQVVGTLQSKGVNYDIVYFGVDKYYKEGSIVDMCIGKYKEYNLSVNEKDYKKSITFTINPTIDGWQIDNLHMILLINNKLYDITKIMEDYMIKEVATEMTTKEGGVEVWIGEHNDKVKYGIPINFNDQIKLCYMETYGKDSNIFNIVKNNQLSIVNNINIHLAEPVLIFEGYNEDELSKITRLSRLLYMTAKRAVTLRDHEIIANNFPLIHDSYAINDITRCCTIILYYIKEGSKDIPLVFSDYEVQMFEDYFADYTVGPDIDLYPATCRVLEFTFNLFLKRGVRPRDDYSGEFEYNLSREVEQICQKKNLKLGVQFTIGELLADIYKIYEFEDGYVIDSNNFNEILPSTVVKCDKAEYVYIKPKVKIIAENSRDRV